MSDWNNYPETTPPVKWEKGVQPVWYLVKYLDGEIGQACWWLDSWYQNSKGLEVVAWKELG